MVFRRRGCFHVLEEEALNKRSNFGWAFAGFQLVCFLLPGICNAETVEVFEAWEILESENLR